MPDKYYSKEEINKRISERLKPKKPLFSIAQRLQGLRRLVPRRKLPRIK